MPPDGNRRHAQGLRDRWNWQPFELAHDDDRPPPGWQLLERCRRLGITRHSTFPMFERMWELRDDLSAYDAAYVALAEALDCTLVTGDARISAAPGLRCPVTVVPG